MYTIEKINAIIFLEEEILCSFCKDLIQIAQLPH